MNVPGQFHRRNQFQIWAILLALAVAYSIYLLPFTVFDGFATFSNDAGSYVLTARKWSPYFIPTLAEQFTQPLIAHPPGFSAFLALTGASETLRASHIAVSICMLLGLVLFGYYASLQLGNRLAIFLLITLCALPGVMINTLGILSENLYLLLSLGALVMYLHIQKRPGASPVSYALIFVLLAAVLLTRTVGIALVAAFVIAPMCDRGLARRKKVVVVLLALGSVVPWQLWEMLRTAASPVEYGLLLSLGAYDLERSFADVLIALWQLVNDNMLDLLRAWSQYFSLNHGSVGSYALTYLFLVLVIIGLGLRLTRLRMDAVYSAAYLAVVLLWPTELEELRLLHPILPLLVLQPFLYLAEEGFLRRKRSVEVLAGGFLGLVILLAVVVQIRVVDMRNAARAMSPRIDHSREYYFSTGGGHNEKLAKTYAATSALMEEIAKYIPENSRVAAVSHEHVAILTNRPTVTLTNVVPRYQQFCNFELMDVDYILASQLVFFLNAQGRRIRDNYTDVTRETWNLKTADGEHEVFLLTLDRDLLNRGLQESAEVCDSVQYLRQEHTRQPQE